MPMQRLRYHHLFCIPLYSGSGYSTEFCTKMDEFRNSLTNDIQIGMVCENDDICKFCPNSDSGGCGLDSKNCRISDRDMLIKEKLGSSYETENFCDILFRLEKLCDEHFFLSVCGECRWYKAGLCSYNGWQKGIKKFHKN